MSFEMMVGLQIKDDAIYSQYRDAMAPILLKFGGGFRYDFKVAETLKNEEERPINRVFAIYFSNKDNMDKFFNDKEYLIVKSEFFETSVEFTTIISEYSR
jgi:uncharacterized protein (DUF1330 family)